MEDLAADLPLEATAEELEEDEALSATLADFEMYGSWIEAIEAEMCRGKETAFKDFGTST